MRLGAAVDETLVGVKHCFATGCESGTKAMQTKNTIKASTSETVGDKLHRRKGEIAPPYRPYPKPTQVDR